MKPRIIIRYNEIAIKGRNRSMFEKQLAANIQEVCNVNNIECSLQRKNTRIIVHIPDPVYAARQEEPIKNVFGISSFSYALEIPNDIDAIKEAITTLLKGKDFSNKTFRVSTRNVGNKRGTDSFAYNKVFGAFIAGATGMKVSLKDFDLEIGIEVMDDLCYVFDNRIQGYGGLPLGSQGTVYCLIEDEKSIVAAWFMMKRGCEVILVLNETSKQSELANKLNKFNNYNLLQFLPLTDIPNKAVIVTGATLGQKSEANSNNIVLKPLIGKSKEEIESILKTLS
ncbi:hypothetical protein HYV81_03880 [Candidatus Woesearchaeota archaeon]|nr:hypothetical protein [Candidatus Woesearchaeota archaeon]